MAYSGPRKGRVIDVVDGAVISDATFVISESGQARVRRERTRNVHAFVEGSLVETFALGTLGARSARSLVRRSEGMVPITYHPYKYDHFMRTDVGRPIESAPLVVAGPLDIIALAPRALSANPALPLDSLDDWNGPLRPNALREPFRSLLARSDRLRLERMERAYRRLARDADAAYERGDLDRATELDARADRAAELLESVATEITEDRDPVEKEEETSESIFTPTPDDPTALVQSAFVSSAFEPFIEPSQIPALIRAEREKVRRARVSEGADETEDEALARTYAEHLHDRPGRAPYGSIDLEEALHALYHDDERRLETVMLIERARVAYERRRALIERYRAPSKLRIGPALPSARRRTSRREAAGRWR